MAGAARRWEVVQVVVLVGDLVKDQGDQEGAQDRLDPGKSHEGVHGRGHEGVHDCSPSHCEAEVAKEVGRCHGSCC